jgi:hypothetical protein
VTNVNTRIIRTSVGERMRHARKLLATRLDIADLAEYAAHMRSLFDVTLTLGRRQSLMSTRDATAISNANTREPPAIRSLGSTSSDEFHRAHFFLWHCEPRGALLAPSFTLPSAIAPNGRFSPDSR